MDNVKQLPFKYLISDTKFLFVLDTIYGNDGYAFWFHLLEIIGPKRDYIYDFTDAKNEMYLLARTHVTKDKAVELINALVDLGKIDKQLWVAERKISLIIPIS